MSLAINWWLQCVFMRGGQCVQPLQLICKILKDFDLYFKIIKNLFIYIYK
jgi:hypothetical protein